MIKKLVVLGLLLLVGDGCATEDSGATEETQKSQMVQESKRKIEKREVVDVVAENGEIFHYTLPKGWEKRVDEKSDFFASSSKEGVNIFISDRGDFENFTAYQNAFIKGIESLGDNMVEQGNTVGKAGMSGVEFVVEMDREGQKFKTLMYVLETEKNYLEIHASTHRSRFDGNREVLKEAADSLERAEK